MNKFFIQLTIYLIFTGFIYSVESQIQEDKPLEISYEYDSPPANEVIKDYQWHKVNEAYSDGVGSFRLSGYSVEEALLIADSDPEITAFSYFDEGVRVYAGGIDYATDSRYYQAGTAIFHKNSHPDWRHETGVTGYYKIKNPYRPTYQYTQNTYMDYLSTYTGPFENKAVYHAAQMSLDDAFKFADNHPEVTHIFSYTGHDGGYYCEVSKDDDFNTFFDGPNTYYYYLNPDDKIFFAGNLPSWLTWTPQRWIIHTKQ